MTWKFSFQVLPPALLSSFLLHPLHLLYRFPFYFTEIQPLWKAVWKFPQRLEIEPPYDLAIPLTGIYPKELKSTYYKDLATSVFIAAQSIVAKS